jgi:hypothetical protein
MSVGHPSLSRSSSYVTDYIRGTHEYLKLRFPLHILGVAIAAAYACGFVLFNRIYDRTSSFGVGVAIGAVSEILLFLQLRLVDDIEDISRDPITGVTQRGLLVALPISAVVVIALNWSDALALAIAAGAIGIAVVTSFVLKPVLKTPAAEISSTGSARRDAVLSVFFEGAPCLIIVYGYTRWAHDTGGAVRPASVIAVSGLFWMSYEYWKYSRYMTRSGWRPYGLSWPQARIALIGILIAAFIFQMMIVTYARLPSLYLFYALCVTVAFIAITSTGDPANSKLGVDDMQVVTSRHGSLAGILFVALVNLGLAGAMVI